jgi:hypothetical protein
MDGEMKTRKDTQTNTKTRDERRGKADENNSQQFFIEIRFIHETSVITISLTPLLTDGTKSEERIRPN